VSQAIELAYERLVGREEGRRAYAYNDATGQRVTCRPTGNLSIAVGVDLEIGLDNDEIDWLSKHRLGKVETSLSVYAWYQHCDPVRQSVLLDVAFNVGVLGLLHFVHMIAAIQHCDWPAAQAECSVQDPRLRTRYERLGRILLTGDAGAT
jgi:lysozyme